MKKKICPFKWTNYENCYCPWSGEGIETELGLDGMIPFKKQTKMWNKHIDELVKAGINLSTIMNKSI